MSPAQHTGWRPRHALQLSFPGKVDGETDLVLGGEMATERTAWSTYQIQDHVKERGDSPRAGRRVRARGPGDTPREGGAADMLGVRGVSSKCEPIRASLRKAPAIRVGVEPHPTPQRSAVSGGAYRRRSHTEKGR